MTGASLGLLSVASMLLPIGAKAHHPVQGQSMFLISPQEVDDMDATRIISPGNFGPETVAAKEKNRTREGISPVAYSAREKVAPTVR